MSIKSSGASLIECQSQRFSSFRINAVGISGFPGRIQCINRHTESEAVLFKNRGHFLPAFNWLVVIKAECDSSDFRCCFRPLKRDSENDSNCGRLQCFPHLSDSFIILIRQFFSGLRWKFVSRRSDRPNFPLHHTSYIPLLMIKYILFNQCQEKIGYFPYFFDERVLRGEKKQITSGKLRIF